MSPPLSIVIPVHNEVGFLEPAIADLRASLADLSPLPEIVLVENGSTDGTAAAVRLLTKSVPGLRLLELKDPDYGAALRAGFGSAHGDWVVSFDIDYCSRAFIDDVIASNADVVVASKCHPASEDRRSLLRRAGTRVFNFLLRRMMRSRVTDTHGMKAFRRLVIEDLLPAVKSRHDLLDTELILRAERAGYKLEEVPAVVEEQRPTSAPFLTRVPRALIGMLRLHRNIG